MKLRRGSGVGSTLPVEIIPETTPDDDFEERAVEWLKLYHFPDGGFQTHPARAWPLRISKKYLRPDIVTLIANTDTVVFVGDAKRHKRLEKREVEKVVKYRQATRAEKAAVFVPRACKVATTVQAFAEKMNIDIVCL